MQRLLRLLLSVSGCGQMWRPQWHVKQACALSWQPLLLLWQQKGIASMLLQTRRDIPVTDRP